MDNTNSIQSLTDDILSEVDSQEKVASEKAKPELTTEIGLALTKCAAELRHAVETGVVVSYDDLHDFTTRMNGLV